MRYELNFLSLACQTCQAKIHCEQCGEELTRSLLSLGGITDVQINMTAGSMTIDAEINEDEIEMHIEDIGLFLS